MGLDTVELVLAFEESFGLAIPNEDAEQLITPGDVIRYVERRLTPGSGACLEQRAFYRLRQASMTVLGQPRDVLRPASRWRDLLPSDGRRRAWRDLGGEVALSTWPSMLPWGLNPAGHATMGDTARCLATFSAAALQPPGGGWSRAQIESVVTRIVREQLGIGEFSWDDRFVQDLGAD